MSSEEPYVCTLDKASLKKAEEELNETDKERNGAVESLRQWVIQNNKWLKSPTDTKFLLYFLRIAKFAQLAARKRLVNYWTSRSETREWFGNIDTTDSKLVECLRTGFVVLPQCKDKEGRSLLLGRAGYMDVSGKYTVDEMMKASTALLDLALMDENFQVNGAIIMEDISKMSLKHQTFFGVENLKKMMNVFVKSYPVRYKGLHYFNINPVFEVLFTIISPLLPEKLKRRLHIHGSNLTDVYKHIDMCLFPEEYLPDDYSGNCPGNLEKVIEDSIKELQKPGIRAALLKLSSEEYGVINTLKPNDEELYSESFRKLNID